MRVRDLIPARRRSVLTTATTVVTAGAVTAAALLYPGMRQAELDLNDGGVWVVSKAKNGVARLNFPSKTLDSAVTAASTDFDVLQRGRDVLLEDGGGAQVQRIDPAEVRLGPEQGIPAAAALAFGGSTVAVADSESGHVWAVPASSIPGAKVDDAEPHLAAGKGSVAAVGAEGTVAVADPEAGTVTTLTFDGGVPALGARPADTVETRFDALKGAKDVQIAVVGAQPVAFDSGAGRLFLPGGKTVDVPGGAGGKLQQSGPASGAVAVATTTSLAVIPLDGGAPSSVPLASEGSGAQANTGSTGSTGTPAAPVQLNGCIHAAWDGADTYVRQCGGAPLTRSAIPKASPSPDYVFRVNRDLVVLNDVNAGTVWLVTENMFLVDNWDEVMPTVASVDNAEKDSPDEVQATQLPDRSKPNSPPVAKPDAFGVRPGRTTLLPVLENDSDPDGDILTVASDARPASGTLEPVYGRTGFQIAAGPDAKGAETFGYTVDDGRGLTAGSSVTVTVVPLDTNRPPKEKPGRSTGLVVQAGAQVTRNILADWMDPDGDDLYLAGAVPSDPRDTVKTSPDGTLTFTDGGSGPGRRTVTVTVSDGRSSTEARLGVDVRPGGGLPPTAIADHVTAIAGVETKVAPLLNDIDPQGASLRLAMVTPGAEASATLGSDQQTFAFSSERLGTHYVEYMVTNGPASARQLVRVDVVAPNGEGRPVAVRDVAALPAGGSVLVDVLGNDSDPAGGVLVVQSVSVPDSAPVNVTVLEHSVVRITDVRASGTVTLKYTMSNGRASATGEISVVVVPAPAKLLPPQAKPDEADVRAGDVVTIPVLANDTDPQGGELSLVPELVQSPDPAAGLAFTSGKDLRFLAGEAPGTVYAIYRVTNASGQSDSQQVTIHIRARDGAPNSAPQPRGLTARVLSGNTVRIPVPLSGIDPDGDSVTLAGIGSAPSLGTAVAAAGYIDYLAAATAHGTDAFTYRVRDRQGAESTGTVLVGIAPQGAVNQSPQAADDSVTVRPGRRVAVDALANDADPDGDTLALVPDGFASDPELAPSADERGRVLLTAPQAAGVSSVTYSVSDPKGSRASAAIRVESSPQAPLRVPDAEDDFVSPAETLGKTVVSVPVLRNDSDPDGTSEDLRVGVDGAAGGAGSTQAQAGPDGTVQVTLTPEAQVIPYTVTDVDGLSATALVWVPGISEQRPTLKGAPVPEVQAGQQLALDLRTYVSVREGRTPRISVAEKVRFVGASGSADSGAIGADGSTLVFAALPEYAGRGSVTFEVTDGSGPDDPAGLTSTLTVFVDVLANPDKNHQPAFQGSALDVPQGETAELDLAPLASDPDSADRDRLKFALAGAAPAGLGVELAGSRLRVKAEASSTAGSLGAIPVTVTDGRSDPISAVITARVVSSSRPLAVANDDAVPAANAGRTERVDVLANDSNPFPETPLKIVAATVETGEASAPQIAGGTLSVTPGQQYKGVLVVRYTVEDATGEQARRVDGRLRLTVRAAPDAPGAPTASDVRDRTAVLKWTPPSDNGAPITKYTVRSGSFSQECPTTTCTLTGLTNNQPYRFTVIAVNEVGDSEPSAESNEVRPDVKPAPPQAPALTFGDRQLSVAWPAATTTGSPVKHYNLEISPAPASGVALKQGVTGLSHVWTGLTNGVDYRVRVQAVNDAPTPSDWGPYSSPEHPSSVPGAPAAPTATAAQAVGSQAQITVTWTEPATNGDPILEYTVAMSGGGAAAQTQKVAGSVRTATFTAGTSETPYTFTVQAANRAGTGPVSAPSAPRRATGQLGTVTGVSAAPANTGGNGTQVTIRFTPLSAAQRNGSTATEVSYTYQASTGQSGPITPGQTVGGFANGTATSITVTARSSAAPSSAPSAPATATPYGAPGTPSASGRDGIENQKSLTLSWSSPAASVADVAQTKISIDNGAWQTVAASGSRTINTAGFNETHSIRVQTFNSIGTGGPIASASAKSGPPQSQWTTRLHDGMYRSCTDTLAGGSYDTSAFTCDGAGGFDSPWFSKADTIVVKCWVTHTDSYGYVGPWYRIEPGSSRNVGRYVDAGHLLVGGPNVTGAPRC